MTKGAPGEFVLSGVRSHKASTSRCEAFKIACSPPSSSTTEVQLQENLEELDQSDHSKRLVDTFQWNIWTSFQAFSPTGFYFYWICRVHATEMVVPMWTKRADSNGVLWSLRNQMDEGFQTDSVESQKHSSCPESQAIQRTRCRFHRVPYPRCRYFVGIVLWCIICFCTFADRTTDAPEQIHPFSVASTCKPSREDRSQDPEAHCSFDTARDFMASICKPYAQQDDSCTPKMHHVSCQGSARIASSTTRTSRSAHQAARDADACNRSPACDQERGKSASSFCRTGSACFAGTPIGRNCHTAHICRRCSSTGADGSCQCRYDRHATDIADIFRRASKSDRATQCRSNGFRLRSFVSGRCPESIVAIAFTTRHVQHAHECAARRMGLASTCATSSKCPEPSISGRQPSSNDSDSSCRHQHPATRDHASQHGQNRSTVAIYAVGSSHTESSQRSCCSITSPANSPRWGWRQCTDCCTPGEAEEICRTATTMSTADDRSITTGKTQRRGCQECIHTSQSNPYWPCVAQRFSFHSQFTRSDKVCEVCTSAIFVVARSQQTSQSAQSEHWSRARSSHGRIDSRDHPHLAIIQPICDASANRDSVRRVEWPRCSAGAGLASCQGLTGPTTPYAADSRTQFISPSVHDSGDFDSPCKSPVVISLDQLLPFTTQERSLSQVSELFSQLQQPWPEDSMIRDLGFLNELPDLDPAIRHMLSQLPTWDAAYLPKTDAIHIYVDGSSFENRQTKQYTCAAWACIIIAECSMLDNARYMFFAAMSHTMSRACMNSSEFCGVGEISNDPTSTEAAGMIVAMSWVAQSPFRCCHTIHYDNCTVGRYAEGKNQWNADWEHVHLKQNIHGLRHCLCTAQIPVAYSHVKAHEGNPCNEAVDSLAKATAKQILLPSRLPAVLSAVLLNRYFPLSWMTLANPATVPTPAAMSGTFRAEGPFSGQQVDDTWWHPKECPTEASVQVSISVATANVLTLESGSKTNQNAGLLQTGRIATLQVQFAHAGHHVIGLQECRTQSQVTRHSASHLVYQSGASSNGQHGCELWLDRVQPYAWDARQQFCFQPDHVHIASFDDRHLFAIIRAPHMHIRILVLHAPHQNAHDHEFHSWWDRIHELVIRTSSSLPLIVLGDMNAKLGSSVSDSVGPFHAELENQTGHCLHAFMMEHDLFAPSTFAEFHEGPSHTWTAPEGSKHRLDFVLLPNKWKSHQIRSFVQYEVDLCTVRDDHDVAAVEIQMEAAISLRHHTRKHRIDTRLCQDPSARRKFLDFLAQPPQIDWSVGGLHAEILTRWLQQGTQCFQPVKPLPRQRYMSDKTWQIAQVRKKLRALAQQAEQHDQLMLLRHVFDAWSQANRIEIDLNLTPATQHVCRRLQHQLRCSLAMFMHFRYLLHSHARHSSKSDRIMCAQHTVDSFLKSAQGHNSRELYRCLKPLLGQTHRKVSTCFRPVPAVRLLDNSLATSHEEAASRWQQHFAAPEQGIAVTFDQMRELAVLQNPIYHPDEAPFDLSCVPTLEAIETQIHKSRRGKCPGIDGLPSEVYQIHPDQMARILWPLMSKCSLRCCEPLRWRGGSIFALPKVLNPGASAEQYRSILLADFSSKLCHGMLRKRLLPALNNYKLNMQAGGIPGVGTDMLQLYVQSFVQLACTAKHSCALIFVDIRQAFYQACRPLLIGRHVTEEMLAALFSRQGWSPESFQSFRDRMHEEPALLQARVTAHERAQVTAMLTGTWFHLRDQPATLTNTASGTRPGDSMADILYAFMMARFLASVREEFIQQGLHSEFPINWIPHGSLAPGDIPDQHIVQASWVDDFVLLLRAEDPVILLAKVKTAMGIVQGVAASYALQLNYNRDKTSALMNLRGHQARRLWTQILESDPANPYLEFTSASLTKPGRLAVVPGYVYLGQLQDGKGHPASEVHRRFLETQASSRLLKRNVFRSPRMPTKTKLMLFKSLVLSKVTFGASAWQHMHIHTAQKWSRQLINLYSSASPSIKHGPGVMNIDIIADCRLPPPMLLLAQQRFSLFDRLIQSEMLELYAVLQAQQVETSWFQLILHDLHRLAEQYPAHPVLADDVLCDIHALAQHVHHNPRALTKVGKWAVKHFQKYLSLWKSFREFQQQFQETASRFGITWSVSALPANLSIEFECNSCQARFATFQALCTHEFKRHASVNIAQRYAWRNQCRACLKVYASRTQLLHHLKYFRTGCLLKLVTNVEPINDESLQELLQQQRDDHKATKGRSRAKQHKIPMVQATGPLRPWPWQRSLQLALDDTRSRPSMSPDTCNAWITRVLEATQSGGVAEVYALLCEQPYHGSFAMQILQAFDGADCTSMEDKVSAHLDLQDAIHLWQDDHFVCPSKHTSPCLRSLLMPP